MNISPEEAHESLVSINEVAQRTNQAVAATASAYYLIIWGIVWVAGPLVSHFVPSIAPLWLWGFLFGVACFASGLIGAHQGGNVRQSSGARIGGFFSALYSYTAILLWVVWPIPYLQVILVILLSILFGIIAAGIWLHTVSLIVYGSVLAALALIGYVLLSAYFWLWIAVIVGGTLLAHGLYLLIKRSKQ